MQSTLYRRNYVWKMRKYTNFYAAKGVGEMRYVYI